MYQYGIKRILDIILSFIGIIILAIPMAIIAVLIKLDSPGRCFSGKNVWGFIKLISK